MYTKLLCHTTIKKIEEYFELDNCLVYVRDLKHQAPQLINEAVAKKIKIYSALAKRKTQKERWIQTTTYGITTPTTIKIQFSNNCILLDYSLFDKNETVAEPDMLQLATILNQYGNCLTGCKIIGSLIRESIAKIPELLHEVENDNYFILKDSLRGGANAVIDYSEIPYETHIDYHQLYASVMISHNFPCLQPKIVDGYFPHEFGLYLIACGRARLKKDGYALLSRVLQEKMAGLDGEWFDLASTIGCICDPDLKLLYENYEVEDMGISQTIYYPNSFSGEKEFTDVVKEIYNNRKKSEGSIKRFYKLMNEYLAGFFERTYSKGTWWNANEPIETKPKLSKRNPIVGIFITAYGRQQLNALLHAFPHDKVIGYDTDCVFFRGKPDEVPPSVLAKFGEEMGQLHFDGIYKNVIHKASKSYSGWDLETNDFFNKQAGTSKSGMRWSWNKESKIYEIKEVLYEEG